MLETTSVWSAPCGAFSLKQCVYSCLNYLSKQLLSCASAARGPDIGVQPCRGAMAARGSRIIVAFGFREADFISSSKVEHRSPSACSPKSQNPTTKFRDSDMRTSRSIGLQEAQKPQEALRTYTKVFSSILELAVIYAIILQHTMLYCKVLFIAQYSLVYDYILYCAITYSDLLLTLTCYCIL